MKKVPDQYSLLHYFKRGLEKHCQHRLLIANLIHYFNLVNLVLATRDSLEQDKFESHWLTYHLHSNKSWSTTFKSNVSYSQASSNLTRIFISILVFSSTIVYTLLLKIKLSFEAAAVAAEGLVLWKTCSVHYF